MFEPAADQGEGVAVRGYSGHGWVAVCQNELRLEVTCMSRLGEAVSWLLWGLVVGGDFKQGKPAPTKRAAKLPCLLGSAHAK